MSNLPTFRFTETTIIIHEGAAIGEELVCICASTNSGKSKIAFNQLLTKSQEDIKLGKVSNLNDFLEGL